MEKWIKLLIIPTLMFFLIASISFVSAGWWTEWNNVKHYNESEQEILIRNSILKIFSTNTILRVTLNTPQVYYVGAGYQKVAQFTINPEKDYNNVLGQFEFYDLRNNGKGIDKQIDVKYLTYEQIEIQIYNNETGKIESHFEEEEVWLAFDNNLKLNKTVVIGLFTIVGVDDKVEWIPKIAGIKISEWAAYEYDEEAHGISLADSVTNANIFGFKIHIHQGITLFNITKHASSAITVCYLYNDTNSQLATASFSGNLCTITPINLTAGKNYAVATGGGSFNRQYGSIGVSTNVTGKWINWTGGYDTNWATASGNGFDILKIGVARIIAGNALSATLNSPGDGYGSNLSSVTFNCSATDETGVVNLTLIINSIDNHTITNSSAGQNLSLQTSKNLSDGDHTWTCRASDGTGAEDPLTASTRNLNVNTTPGISFVSPTPNDKINTSTNSFTVNVTLTETYFKNLTFFLYNSSGLFNSTIYTDSTRHINWTNLNDENYNYSATVWTTTNQKNSTAARFLTIDTISPRIIITSPNGTYNLNGSASLNLNYSVSDAHIGSCWYSQNAGATNTTISSCANTTLTAKLGAQTVYIWTNDTANHISSNTTTYHALPTFALCGSNVNQTVLNISFKDEETKTLISGKIDTSSWTYWVNSSVTRTYSYSTTANQSNFTFCMYPPWGNVIINSVIQYSSEGYPQRRHLIDDEAFTNSTTNKIFYLLASADGIYSSIQVIEATGSPLQGVSVLIERQIDDVWIIVGSGTTGSDGMVTFWVNPNYQHKITASKTGYVSAQVTITPSQSTYTLTLSRTAGTAEFASTLEGMEWTVSPRPGYLPTGIHYFTFNLTAALSNLESCKFELVDVGNSTIVGSATGGNSTACNLGISYTLQLGQWIYGKLYVDTTNTTGYALIDSDQRWGNIEGEEGVSTWQTVWSFFNELKDLDEWGICSHDGTCHRAEFSRIVAFFLGLTIIIGLFSYFTGFDSMYPGVASILIFIIIIFASFSGFFTLDLGNQQFDFIKKYAIGLIVFFIAGGWIANYLAKE